MIAPEYTEEAGARMVAEAQTRFDAATQKVTDAEARLQAMRESGTAQETRQKAHQALALKRARDEQKAAQKAVAEVEETIKTRYETGLIRRGLSHVVGPSVGAGTFAFLYGMTHSTPLVPFMLATGSLGIGLEASRWAMPAFARTQVGQRLMRDGLKHRYGEGAARWVNQVFVQTPEQQEGEPVDATTP